MNIANSVRRLLGKLPITNIAYLKTGAKVVVVHMLNPKPDNRFVATVASLVTHLDQHRAGGCLLSLRVDTVLVPDSYVLKVADGGEITRVVPGFTKLYYPGLLDF